MSRLSTKTLNKWYPRILTLGSLIGLIASFWQVVERIHMLKDPGVALSCNINPVVDCGSVLSNRWAALFGFPNALLGIVMFTILLTIGLMLISGMELKKWFWKILLGVMIMVILFSVWFFGMSLYVIGKVCIFCLFIWTVSVPIFLYGIDWLITNKYLKGSWTASRSMNFLRKNQTELLVSTYALMILLYLYRFRDFYF